MKLIFNESNEFTITYSPCKAEQIVGLQKSKHEHIVMPFKVRTHSKVELDNYFYVKSITYQFNVLTSLPYNEYC